MGIFFEIWSIWTSSQSSVFTVFSFTAKTLVRLSAMKSCAVLLRFHLHLTLSPYVERAAEHDEQRGIRHVQCCSRFYRSNNNIRHSAHLGCDWAAHSSPTWTAVQSSS